MRTRALALSVVLTVALAACASGQKGRVHGPGEWSVERSSVDHRVESLLAERRFEPALAIADSLVAMGETDARVLSQKARALAGIGRSAEAISSFEEALLKDYESCENHIAFATYLMQIGKSGRALTEFTEAQKFCEGPFVPIIFRNLVVSCMKLGKPEAAKQYVEEGLAVAKGDPYLLGLKGMLVARERPAEAESLFVQAQLFGEASPEFLVQYGLLLVNAGRAAEAVTVFERAAGARPGNPEIRGLLAEALDRSGRYAEAEEALRGLLAEADNPETRGKLARVLFHEGAFEEALGLYESLEQTPEMLDRVAMCLHNLGRSDEALARERAAVAAKPDWPQGMINLAVILGARGELDEAERLLERVLVLEPDNAAARANLERLREAKQPGARR